MNQPVNPMNVRPNMGGIPFGYQRQMESTEQTQYTLTPVGKERIRNIPQDTPEFLVLAMLEEVGSASAAEIGRDTHKSPSKIHHVLKMLSRAGYVKLGGNNVS